MLFRSAIAAMGLMCAMQAQAEQPVELPTIQDRPVLEGYGSAKVDVLGIRLGEGREDAIQLIKSTFPNAAIEEHANAMRLVDSRGNQLTWRYAHAISVTVPGEPAEVLTIRFTSKLTGGRVYQIERMTTYPSNSPGDMKSLREGVVQKYGQPTVVERYDHQNRIEITFTWEKRPAQRFAEQDVAKRPFNAVLPSNANPCLLAATAAPHRSGSNQVYSYLPPGGRKDNPGWDACIGGIRFVVFYGPNPHTISSMTVVATDYGRSMQDARLLDEFLTRLLDEKARGVRGTGGAPKL